MPDALPGAHDDVRAAPNLFVRGGALAPGNRQ